MLKKSILAVSILSTAASLGFAAAKGTSGAQFLKLVASPRIAAMGQTYTAVSDDVNSIAFNPAGLGFLKKKEAALVQNLWIQDITNQYVAAGVPVENFGTLGLGINMVSVKDITKMNSSQVAQGSYNASDMAVTLAYASRLQNNLSLGLSIKMISSKIDDESATAYGADAGIIYKTSEKLDLGFAVQNIGTELKYINEGDPLPMVIRLGGAYKPKENLLVGMDISYPNDSDIIISLGSEYVVKAGERLKFPLRLGYRTGYETEEMSGLGAGFGVLYDNLLSIDTAWTPMGILGDSVKFGIGFKF